MAGRGGVGAAPLTEAVPITETSAEALRLTSRRTPTDARYIGDARRGARSLGTISILVSIAAIGAEIASILQAVSGSQQAKRLNWPIAKGVWGWDKCEFLPNSDAPATTYGAGVSLFYHALNIVVLIATLSYLIRFTLRPKANYGIGAVGLLFWWLGLGLMSRWLGTIQLGVGAVMLFIGFLDFWFGYDKLMEAFRKAYGVEKAKPKKEAPKRSQEQIDNEKNRQTAQDITRLLSAYVPLNPIAGGGGFRGGGGF